MTLTMRIQNKNKYSVTFLVNSWPMFSTILLLYNRSLTETKFSVQCSSSNQNPYFIFSSVQLYLGQYMNKGRTYNHIIELGNRWFRIKYRIRPPEDGACYLVFNWGLSESVPTLRAAILYCELLYFF